jgi:hypothetical protein
MATSGPWPPADVAGDFTLEESWALVALVACIIPASPRRGLPSAADPAILRVILDAASKQAAELSSALRGFAGLARDDPHQACAAFRQRFPANSTWTTQTRSSANRSNTSSLFR